MPIWPEYSNTTWTTSATSWSGPRRAKPRHAWRSAGWRASARSLSASTCWATSSASVRSSPRRRSRWRWRNSERWPKRRRSAWPIPKRSSAIIAEIDACKKTGDTLGGVVEVTVTGLPVGLGSHVHWDRKLDGRLAYALLSLQAVKGVEFGMGFEAAAVRGSQLHDEIGYDADARHFTRLSNNSGGTEGGMSAGEPLRVRVAFKPLSTLMQPLHSVDIKTKAASLGTIERSDVCCNPGRRLVIAEAAVAFELANSFLEKFGGDSLTEIRRNYQGYMEQVRILLSVAPKLS